MIDERPRRGPAWFAGQQTPPSVCVALAGAAALVVLAAGRSPS